jgi:hypothetical protein
MPFQVLTSITTEAKAALASVSYAKPQGRGSNEARRPRLVVGVPGAAFEGLKFPAGQRFAFAMGSGKEAGRARIVMAAEGPTSVKRLDGKGAKGKGGGVFRFVHVPALGQDAAAKEFVAFRVLDPKKEGGAIIEIDCPAWLKVE